MIANRSVPARRRRRLLLESLEDRRVLESHLDAWQPPADPGVTDSAAAEPAFAHFASDAALEQWLLKDALQRYEAQFGQPAWGGWHYYDVTADLLVGSPARDLELTSVSRESYSTTNTQIAGVDEADLVETDGQFVYLIQNGEVSIVDAANPDVLLLASQMELDFFPQGIYLHEDRLTVVGVQQPQFLSYPMPLDPMPLDWAGTLEGLPELDFAPFPQTRTTTVVQVLDVSDPYDPRTAARFELEGSYRESRLIDETVYLVSASEFRLPGPEIHCAPPTSPPAAIEDARLLPLDARYWEPLVVMPWGRECVYESAEEYESRMQGQILDRVLPGYEVLDGQGQPLASGQLVPATSIYAPLLESAESLVAVTAIDVGAAEPVLMDTEAIPAGGSSEVFASRDSLYLAQRNWASQDTTTEIAKFDLGRQDDPVQLAAVGSVGGAVLNAFAMDEHGGTFRIVTQEGFGALQNTDLYVLVQDGPRLEVVGTLEDLAPRERLYSVRFEQERAFVVTFGPTGNGWFDPLFTIDLTDPAAPRLAGELEIPGFANYLHMVDQNHLIGLGRDADVVTGRAEEPQVLLYDVTDFERPQLQGGMSFGGRFDWSPAFGDHHAISYFPEDGIFAVPLDLAQRFWFSTTEAAETDEMVWPSALWVFRIDVASDSSPVELLGKIGHSSSVLRSLRIGDRLISLSRNSIQAHSLVDPTHKLAELYLGPGARDDRFGVDHGTAPQTLEVLRNDALSPSTNGRPVITGVSVTERGGTVTVSDNGRTLTYTPPADLVVEDAFTYTIDNGDWGEDTARVQIDLYHLMLEDSTENLLPVIDALELSDDASAYVVQVTSAQADATADISQDGRSVRYTPAPDFDGIDRLDLVVGYAGQAETTRHAFHLRVVGSNDPPRAVDDQFLFREWQPEYFLPVLRNDSSAPDPYESLTVTAVGQPFGGGSVEIAESGRGILYRPEGTDGGEDTFVYTVSDGNGGTAQARVRIEYGEIDAERRMVDLATQDLSVRLEVSPAMIDLDLVEKVDWPDSCLGLSAPDLVCLQVVTPGYRIALEHAGTRYIYHTDRAQAVRLAGTQSVQPVVELRLETVDQDGQSIGELETGERFNLHVYARDVRQDPQGVFAAYLDVLYSSRLVQVDGEIVFGESYPNGHSGETADAGLINEFGAFAGMNPLGSGETLVASIPMRALRAGQAKFLPAEADEVWNEVLVFGSNEYLRPGELVVIGTQLTVLDGWHNLDAPSDVNADGATTPADAAVLVNDLNQLGPRLLQPARSAVAAESFAYVDVSGEGHCTALDLLWVINGMNAAIDAGFGFVQHPLPTHTLAEVVDWQPVSERLQSMAWQTHLRESGLTQNQMLDASFAVMSGFDVRLTRGEQRELLLQANPVRLPNRVQEVFQPLFREDLTEKAGVVREHFDMLFRELELHGLVSGVSAGFDLSGVAASLHDHFFAEFDGLGMQPEVD